MESESSVRSVEGCARIKVVGGYSRGGDVEVQVKKRDGRLEDFDRNKLKNSVIAAGATPEDAEDLTAKIEAWATEMAEEDIIESSAIWEKVIGILETSDPEAAESYKAYRG